MFKATALTLAGGILVSQAAVGSHSNGAPRPGARLNPAAPAPSDRKAHVERPWMDFVGVERRMAELDMDDGTILITFPPGTVTPAANLHDETGGLEVPVEDVLFNDIYAQHGLDSTGVRIFAEEPSMRADEIASALLAAGVETMEKECWWRDDAEALTAEMRPCVLCYDSSQRFKLRIPGGVTPEGLETLQSIPWAIVEPNYISGNADEAMKRHFDGAGGTASLRPKGRVPPMEPISRESAPELRTDAPYDDILISRQYPVENTGQWGGTPGVDMDCFAGWAMVDAYHQSPEWTRVALLSTGIDRQHEEFQNGSNLDIYAATFVEGSTQDYNGLGTAMAGVMAALHNNGVGVAGISHNIKVTNVKVTDYNGVTTLGDLMQGLEWARDQGIDIVVTSVGLTSGSTALDLLLKDLRQMGILVFAPAGGDNSGTILRYPAASRFACAVGAVDYRSQRGDDRQLGFPAEFTAGSNWGPYLDFTGDGWRFVATTKLRDLDPSYPYYDAIPSYPLWFMDAVGGTDVAAAHMAALAVNIDVMNWWEGIYEYHGVPQTLIWEILKRGAEDLFSPGWDDSSGSGCPDLDECIAAVLPETTGVLFGVAEPAYWQDLGYEYQYFYNVPGLTDDDDMYAVRLVDVYFEVYFSGFSGTPYIAAARMEEGKGWANVNPYDYNTQNHWYGWVVDAGPDYMVMATRVYEVWGRTGDPYYGWYPCPPQDARGAWGVVGPAEGTVEVSAGSGEAGSCVISAWPNPSSGKVWILLRTSYETSGGALNIFDVRGRLIRSINVGRTGPGGRIVTWDLTDSQGRPVKSGVYVCRVTEGDEALGSAKIVVSR